MFDTIRLKSLWMCASQVTTGRQLENKRLIREFTRCHWFGTWCAMIRLNIVAFAQDTIEGMRRPDPLSNMGIGLDDTRELPGPNSNTLDPPKVVNMEPGRRIPPPEDTPSTSITALGDRPSGKKLIQPKDNSHEDGHPAAVDDDSFRTSSTPPNTQDVPRKKGPVGANDFIRNSSFNDHSATNEQPSGKELIKQGVERSDRTIEGERPNLDKARAIQSEAPNEDPTEDELPGGISRDFSAQLDDSTKDAVSLSDYSATRVGASGKELIQQGINKSDRNDLVPSDPSSRLVEPGLSPQLEYPVIERLPVRSPVPQGIYDITVFSLKPGDYPSGRSLYVSSSSSSGTVSTLPDAKGPSGRGIVRGSSAGNKPVDNTPHGPGNIPVVKIAHAGGDSQRTSSSTSVCMDSAAGSGHSSSHSQGDGNAKGVDNRGKVGSTARQPNTQEGASIGCIPECPQSSAAADFHTRGKSFDGMVPIDRTDVGPDGGAGRGMIWPFHLTPQNPIPDPIPRRRSSASLVEMSREGSGIAHVTDGMNIREEVTKRLKMELPHRRTTPFPLEYPLRRNSGNGSGQLSASSSGRSYVDTSETGDDPGQTKNSLPRSHGQRNILKIGHKPIEELFPRRREEEYVIQDLPEGDDGDSKQENETNMSKKRRLSDHMGIPRRSGGKQARNEPKSGFDFPTENLNNGLMPKRAVESDHPCRRRRSSISHPIEGRVVTEHEQNAGGKCDIRAEGSEPLKEDCSAQPGSAVMENTLSESGSGTEKEGKIASW